MTDQNSVTDKRERARKTQGGARAGTEPTAGERELKLTRGRDRGDPQHGAHGVC